MKKEQEKKVPKKGSLIIKLIIIAILVAANTFLIIKFVNKKPIKDNTDQIEVTNEKQEEKDFVSAWAEGNIRFIFKDNNFTYYDAFHDYYEGTFTFVKGEQALEEMGYSDEDLEEQFGTGINKENIYSMQLSPTKRVINNEDHSGVIKENTKWWFILIVKDDNTAIGYNKTLDKRYDLGKAVD